MKIAILANRDIAACSALNRLWPSLLVEHDVQLILSSSVGGSGDKRPEKLRELKIVEQVYINDFLFPLLRSLPSERRGAWLDFDLLALQSGRPLWIMNRINEPEQRNQLAGFAPDLILSIRYGVILKKDVIAMPRLGVINLHSGVLPAYRGVMASFWALHNGESEIGTTLHTIDDASIDTGRVLARSSLSVQHGKSYLWHVLALYEAGCANVLTTIESLTAGNELHGEAQGDGENYYSFPDQSAIDEFYRKGFQLYSSEDLLELGQQFTSTDS